VEQNEGPSRKKSFGRMLAGAVLVANILMLSMVVAMLAMSWNEFDRRAKEVSQIRLSGLAQAVEMRFERIKLSQRVVGDELEHQLRLGKGELVDKKKLDYLVAKLNGSDRSIYTLRVTDKNGDIISGFGLDVVPKVNYADRIYFQELKAHPEKVFEMSDLVIGKVSKKGAIVMAMAYKDHEGRFSGVVIGAVVQDSLNKISEPYHLSHDDGIVMRESRGYKSLMRLPVTELSSNADGSLKFQMVPEIKKMIDAGLEKGYLISTDNVDQVERSLSYTKLKEVPVYVFLGVGRWSFFEPWRNQVWTSMVFCFLFGCMSVALARRLLAYQIKSQQSQDDYKALSERLEREVELRTEDLSAALERIRKGRDELADADRLASLGAMVSTVAHELNTPLGNALLCNTAIMEQADELSKSIKSGSVLMTKTEMAKSMERLSDLARMQASAIEKSADLVKAFKQVAVDQSSERRRVFDLSTTISDVVASLGPSLRRAQAKIEVSQKVQESLECDSYPGVLSQIVINIIKNTQAHAFDGRAQGNVAIKGGARQKENGEEWVELIFEDDGVGMSPSVAAQAFDPFFTTKASSGGSGIGLSLSSQLAARGLGGQLSIDGSHTQGARFVLSFPKKAK
jgi:signal transduction histidine kinase